MNSEFGCWAHIPKCSTFSTICKPRKTLYNKGSRASSRQNPLFCGSAGWHRPETFYPIGFPSYQSDFAQPLSITRLHPSWTPGGYPVQRGRQGKHSSAPWITFIFFESGFLNRDQNTKKWFTAEAQSTQREDILFVGRRRQTRRSPAPSGQTSGKW